ncbi:hypothetical protein ACLX1H_005427 [Fusarium chlamydosporum]
MASPSGTSGHLGSESAGDFSAPMSSNSQSPRSINSDDSQREHNQNDHDHNDGQEPICPWQTSRFHHQECSRYFDCPSHTVERNPSDNGEADQASIHSSHSTEIAPPDDGRDQTYEQTSRFSDEELARGGNEEENMQATSTNEADDDRDATPATSDPTPSADDDASTAVVQEPEQSTDTQQNTEVSDTGSDSQNRRSEQHEPPISPSEHPEHSHRPSQSSSATNTQRAQRTYATPSRERMDAPLPSLRPLEEALPPLPRSARQ